MSDNREHVPFQKRVLEWMMACFSMEICRDRQERNHRFLEEALELVQALGCTRSEAHQLVDYTFDRPAGEPVQELGGVMVTIAALCYPNELDMNAAGEIELARIWKKIDVIRAKQAAKPRHSPLPALSQHGNATGVATKSVPIDPTNEQLKAGYDALKLFFPDASGHIGQYRVYEAMLAAAPVPSPHTSAGLAPKPDPVAAEREACAKIAEDFKKYSGYGIEDQNDLVGMFGRGNRFAKRKIAAAIRSRSAP